MLGCTGKAKAGSKEEKMAWKRDKNNRRGGERRKGSGKKTGRNFTLCMLCKLLLQDVICQTRRAKSIYNSLNEAYAEQQTQYITLE